MVDLNSVIGERTRLFNITGHPAVTVPCGFDRAGMPVGLQIAGRYKDETTVLRVASAYEKHAAWSSRLTNLSVDRPSDAL